MEGLSLERLAKDPESRTVDLSFSSETPVERFFGNEVLSHAAGAPDLSLLNDSAPVLLSHNRFEMSGQIGVVVPGSARIDEDGKGRAQIRIANDDDGDKWLSRIRDGIVSKVSMGYRVLKARVESVEKVGGVDVKRVLVTSWQPFELSLVSVPADTSVGINRAIEVIQMPDPIEPVTVTPPPNLDVIRSEAVAGNNTRVAEIMSTSEKWSKVPNIQKLAREAIEKGEEWPDFNKRIMDIVIEGAEAGRSIAPGNVVTDLDLSGNETQKYSLFRAVRAMYVQSQTGKSWQENAGFEAECSREIAERLDREPQGMFVPFDVQARSDWGAAANLRQMALERGMYAYRAPPMSVGLASTEGADLLGVDHMASQFIEALRPGSAVMGLGATVLDGLVGDVDIPKQAGLSQFGWVLEDVASGDTEVPLSTVQLVNKVITGSVPITRKLIKQSSPAVESLVRNDLTRGIGEAIDIAAIQGTGAAGVPLGIRGQTGINTVTVVAAGNPTWAEWVDFETQVASDNALRGGAAYLTTPASVGAGKTRSKDAGSGVFVIEGNVANGYPVRSSTNVPANGFLFGAFSQVLIGMWGTLDINVDVATKAASGGVVLRAFADADVAVRHAQAFSKEA